jgi:hypothetical protein
MGMRERRSIHVRRLQQRAPDRARRRRRLRAQHRHHARLRQAGIEGVTIPGPKARRGHRAHPFTRFLHGVRL